MLTGKEVRIISLLVLDTVFFFLEAIIGYTVHSLALIADSFHMLNDIISLLVALWAVDVAKNKKADGKYTYGWQRAEILGALINGVFLVALCFSIFIEAVQRFVSPQNISNPQLILVVGIAGLVSNFVGLVLFHEHGGHSHSHGGDTSHSHSHSNEVEEPFPEAETPRSQESGNGIQGLLPSSVINQIMENERSSLLEHNEEGTHKSKPKRSLNMEGVFLHVLGDALGNVGVIATALFIWKTDYSWRFYSDPLISVVITIIILSSALPLCKNSSRILLQATPQNISYDKVKKSVLNVTGVTGIHDLHIWNLTESLFIASLHVEISSSPESFLDIASDIKSLLHQFGIHSATIQPEFTHFYQNNNKLPQGEGNPHANGYGSTEATSDEGNCIVDAAVGCDTVNCLPK